LKTTQVRCGGVVPELELALLALKPGETTNCGWVLWVGESKVEV
jgi:hypothetical protein